MGRSFASVKAKFKPAGVDVKLCLDGAAATHVNKLEERILAVDGEERAAVAAELLAAFDALTDGVEVFHLQALSDQAWSDLLAEYPPSPKQREDGYDHDPSKFRTAAVAACCVDPAMTMEEAEQLRAMLSPGQWRRLWNECLSLHQSFVDGVGKALTDSVKALATSTRSEPPSESVSPGQSFSAAS